MKFAPENNIKIICDKYYVRYLSLPALDGGEVSHRVQVAALLGPRHVSLSLIKKY